MIPDNVEKIIMTKEDYDRNVEQLLLDKINVEQEIERLTKQNKALNEMYELTKKEYIRLNNIINELEKWLEVNLTNLEKEKANNTYDKGLKQGMLSNGRLIKNKLQELKGSDSNVKD